MAWTSRQQFRVGLLVLASASLFVLLLAFVLGSSVHAARRVFYVRFLENVKGMVVGSKVNFQGVPIGAVSDIRFDEGTSLVELAVDPDKAVIQDVTRARLDRLLVTGQVTIELEGYAKDGHALPDGATIEPKASPIDQIARTLPQTINDVAQVLASVQRVTDSLGELLGETNRARAARILCQLDESAQRLPAQIEGLIADGRAAVASFASAGAALAAIAERGDVAGALAAARSATARLDAVGARLEALVGELAGIAQSGRGAFLDSLAAARAALDDFAALSRMLRVSPSAVVFGREVREPVPAAPPGGRR
jgi:phospholipid/cholesterol/gamma-HCH transport system substrate-binding protein